ncbi:adenylate/guanylate cyclase domain-containing protein [Mycobacterium sp. 852002-51961_SCH5331710]|uniref:adenylate/guanylate cyclase domain-containing protein n=1 Tax=Mycobacterium sp. 852002-51961_SCH5331710 TaxID=1834105 RepID=UPI00336A2F56
MDGARCPSCGTEVGTRAKFCSECGTPLSRAAGSAEYKQVTVLFADVVHSMDIARAVGPERLREIMADLVDVASAVVARYGGTVDKFTGDGIMAVFGAPLALEDHAVRACLAALGIQAEMHAVAADIAKRDGVDLQLRIGLNSGQVIAGEIGSGALGYTAVGEHVGLAQRMESTAPPGGVMLSASTARLVESVATLAAPESVHVKGGGGPVPARRLLSIGREQVTLRSEAALVGRRWEKSALEGLLDRAIAGQGAVVGISGPPGIGKSRLTRELAATAVGRGVPVYTTACESHTTQVPFHVVARLLRAATGVENVDAASARALIEAGTFPDAGRDDVALLEDMLGIADPSAEPPRIDADSRRQRLIALVNSATLATPAPALYIIEDAHWIDESSESMLAAFLTVIPQTPLLTVITYRPEYRGSLTQVPGTQTIALGPLNDAETADLVSALLGPDPSVRQLTQTVVQKAVGTPFFAEEIIRDFVERGVLQGRRGSYASTAEAADVSVPATLQATIAARIDRLDPAAKRTLSAASVVGSRFGTELLRALDIEPRPAELLTAQLIDQVTFTDEPEFVFHHPLIRAVAYEAQLKSEQGRIAPPGGRRDRTTKRRQSRRERGPDRRTCRGRRRSARRIRLAYARGRVVEQSRRLGRVSQLGARVPGRRRSARGRSGTQYDAHHAPHLPLRDRLEGGPRVRRTLRGTAPALRLDGRQGLVGVRHDGTDVGLSLPRRDTGVVADGHRTDGAPRIDRRSRPDGAGRLRRHRDQDPKR